MKNIDLLKFLLLPLLLSLAIGATAQQFTIRGTTIDALSENPLPGVNIIVKETGLGTISDASGNYSINVNGSGILVFSFIGYQTREIAVDANTSSLNVSLEEDVANLEEIVITGLASSIKRANLANAVSTVSGKELMGSTNPQTLDAALYGKLTGANIIANSGAPGGGITMKLRGITTINGSSQPLFIIDGIYIDNSSISPGTNLATQARTNGEVTDEQDNAANRIADLNPEDIESVEILKGASAAAIYGARANAGVVIITTKRGRPGKTRIRFSQDFGWASLNNKLGSRDWNVDKIWAQFQSLDDPSNAQDQIDAFLQARDEGRLIDYEDELYGEVGYITNTQISASGGTDKTKFFLSGSWKDEEGIVKFSGFERKSARVNIDHKISKLFDFSISTNYIRSSADRAVTNNDNAGVSLGISLVNSYPWVNLFPDESGNYPNNPNASSNPLQTRDLSTVNEQTNRFIGGGSLNVNVLRRENAFLQLVLRGGLDYFLTETFVHFPENLQWQVAGASATNGFLAIGNNRFFNTNSSAILLFNTNPGRISFTSQLGATRLTFSQTRQTTLATQLIGGQANLEQAGSINAFNRNLDTEDQGFFFQQEANWEDKLIATAGVRFDRSSLNGDPDELFAYPKVSLAGNIHNFPFFNLTAISQLKLRVAYGEAGGVPTADQISLQQPAFTTLTGTTIDGNAGSIVSLVRGNEDIQPERSKEFEAGVDVGILAGRVSLEATYYNKQVEDLILLADEPASAGFQDRTINGGELRNRGVELALNVTPISTGNIRWNSKFNFWRNRSKVLRLDVPAFDAPNAGFASFLGIFRIQEGSSATQIVGPTPGAEGDVKIGDAEPDFQLSWFSNVIFLNNFEFNMLFHWKEGGENINLTSLLADFAGTSPDFDDDDDGNGIPDGTDRTNAFINRNNAAAFIEDASYLKLREISLYYTIPKEIISNTFDNVVERIRVGVSANNILVWTPYNSYDPEVSNFGSQGVSTGVEVAPFPASKRIFAHLSIDF